MSLSMITDRTAADVNTAAALRLKIQSGQTLTENEQGIFERGACTITMLNRVENAQKYLAEVLNGHSYKVSITNKTWQNNQIFEYADYIRLLDNESTLKNAFAVYKDTPKTPDYLYGWQEANDIEKILIDIEALIGEMKKNFKKCGTFKCGGDIL